MTSTQRNQQHNDKINYQQGRRVRRKPGIEGNIFPIVNNTIIQKYQKISIMAYISHGAYIIVSEVKLSAYSKRLWKWNRCMAIGRQPKFERTLQSFLMIFIVIFCIIDAVNTELISDTIPSIHGKHSSRAAEMAGLNTQILPTSSACRDNQSYRDPIGRDCAQHKNASCIYRNDFTDTQIIDLIKSCPLACNVPCESSFKQPTSSPTVPSVPPRDEWQSHQFDITLYISSIPSLMTEDTEKNFELYMFTYFTSSLKESEMISNTVLESLSLRSQEFLVSRRLRIRDTRYLKSLTHERVLSSSPILNVVISISVVSLKENVEELSHFFLEAVDNSQAIERTLRLDQFFENATVASRPPKNQKQSTATINIVIVSSVLLLICIAVIIGFAHHIYNRMKPFPIATKDSSQTETDTEDVEASANEVNNIPSLVVNNSKQKPQQLMILTKKTATPPKKSCSTEHTIPPMIVIDNIEDELPTTYNQMESNLNIGLEVAQDDIQPNNVEDNSGMRVKRIEASSAFAEALSVQKSSNPMQMYKFLGSIQSQDDDSKSGISPKSLISSRRSICDTVSAVSTPATANVDDNKWTFGGKISLQEENLFTFEKDNDIDTKDDFNALFEKSMKADGKRFIRFKRIFHMSKDQGKQKKDHNDEHSSFRSHYESDAERSEASSMMRERDRREISKDPLNLSYQAFGTQTNILVQKGINKVLAIEEPKMTDKSDREPEDDINLMKQASGRNIFQDESSQCSLDLVARHTRNNSRESSSTTDPGSRSGGSIRTTHNRRPSDGSNDNLFFYSFLAPSRSKLGITIQSETSTGPVIIQVKDYSPLFGMVQAGDKIIAVDDVDISYMTTSQITELLSFKRSDKNMKEIKVTVMSNNKKDGLQSDENGALKYHTMSSESARPFTKEDPGNGNSETSKRDQNFRPVDTIFYNQSDSEASFHMMAGCESEDEESFM